jgi:hypothetical protein
MATKKVRQGPSASATAFNIGTKKKGNDGNYWIVVATKSNVHRWQKIANNKSKRSKVSKVSNTKKNQGEEEEEVWGKNKKLEIFWRNLAKGETVVVIKKNNDYKIIKLQKKRVAEHLSELNNDPNVVALLSSFISQDAYELYLYPKAQDSSVEYVIKNYKKFFKAYGQNPKDPNMWQLFEKVMYPY